MKSTTIPIMMKPTQSEDRKEIAALLGRQGLILASSSPRRAQILKEAEVEFEIRVPANVNEQSSSSDPVEHVLSLSRAKAQSVSNQVTDGIILGADTIVVLNGEILGKPEDKNQAFLILQKLSGKIHTVYTGVTLVNKSNGRIVSDYDSTEVTFNRLDDEKIKSYINTGEPMDKAGAYGIQGMGNFLVKGIQGSLDNVIGLPTEKLKEMLKKII
jgi:septum formation protein